MKMKKLVCAGATFAVLVGGAAANAGSGVSGNGAVHTGKTNIGVSGGGKVLDIGVSGGGKVKSNGVSGNG